MPARTLTAAPANPRTLTAVADTAQAGTYPGATTFPGASVYPGSGTNIGAVAITPRTLTEAPA